MGRDQNCRRQREHRQRGQQHGGGVPPQQPWRAAPPLQERRGTRMPRARPSAPPSTKTLPQQASHPPAQWPRRCRQFSSPGTTQNEPPLDRCRHCNRRRRRRRWLRPRPPRPICEWRPQARPHTASAWCTQPSPPAGPPSYVARSPRHRASKSAGHAPPPAPHPGAPRSQTSGRPAARLSRPRRWQGCHRGPTAAAPVSAPGGTSSRAGGGLPTAA
mmetsp:Transcript_9750/g.27294  ORF Transcript_9750/g.27294 Transcript_9750/m.27294 type:complete len:216 (-) Transcript_9750:1648-2295(-)